MEQAQEPKKPTLRSLDEIQKELAREQVFAGDLQYRVAAYSQELGRVNAKMGELHAEMQFTIEHAPKEAE